MPTSSHIAGPMSFAAVDIAFTRCKSPGSRRINYPQFLKVLCILGDECGMKLFDAMPAHVKKLGTRGLPPPIPVVSRRNTILGWEP